MSASDSQASEDPGASAGPGSFGPGSIEMLAVLIDQVVAVVEQGMVLARPALSRLGAEVTAQAAHQHPGSDDGAVPVVFGTTVGQPSHQQDEAGDAREHAHGREYWWQGQHATGEGEHRSADDPGPAEAG